MDFLRPQQVQQVVPAMAGVQMVRGKVDSKFNDEMI